MISSRDVTCLFVQEAMKYSYIHDASEQIMLLIKRLFIE